MTKSHWVKRERTNIKSSCWHLTRHLRCKSLSPHTLDRPCRSRDKLRGEGHLSQEVTKIESLRTLGLHMLGLPDGNLQGVDGTYTRYVSILIDGIRRKTHKSRTEFHLGSEDNKKRRIDFHFLGAVHWTTRTRESGLHLFNRWLGVTLTKCGWEVIHKILVVSIIIR